MEQQSFSSMHETINSEIATDQTRSALDSSSPERHRSKEFSVSPNIIASRTRTGVSDGLFQSKTEIEKVEARIYKPQVDAADNLRKREKFFEKQPPKIVVKEQDG